MFVAFKEYAMNLDAFEDEIRNVFDEKIIEKIKNLKRTGHIFNPLFYLLITRLMEASAIINEIFFPNEYELKELFRTRNDLFFINQDTINEVLRRAWLYERKRGREFTFSKGLEDMLYVMHRMGRIQKKIDEIILKYAEWKKESIAELYFTLIQILLEMEDKINLEVFGEKRQSESG